jgi:ribosomal protein L11 methyltransferase
MMQPAAVEQKWFAIEISADPAATEAVEYAFNSLDSLGTEISDMPRDRGETVNVVGYFDELPDDERLRDEIHYALQIYGLNEDSVKTVSHREIANQDWLLEWKKHWKPTVIGRFMVAPPWEEVSESDKLIIRIEPNMAFGTGTHDTTQLCLKAIDEKFVPGQSFLDVGTGTGILAIAAAKSAAEVTEYSDGRARANDPFRPIQRPSTMNSVPPLAQILACDTDPDAIQIARENAAMNSVADRIEFIDGQLPSGSPVFDFVCANLTLDVILPLLPLLFEKTRKTLVLSGILKEQEASITTALRDLGPMELNVARSGEWISVTVCPNRERQRPGSLSDEG